MAASHFLGQHLRELISQRLCSLGLTNLTYPSGRNKNSPSPCYPDLFQLLKGNKKILKNKEGSEDLIKTVGASPGKKCVATCWSVACVTGLTEHQFTCSLKTEHVLCLDKQRRSVFKGLSNFHLSTFQTLCHRC